MKKVLRSPLEEEILNTSIDKLNLSVRAYNVLAKTGIETISDFILFGPEKLCMMQNAGKKTLYEIGNAIKRILSKDVDGNKIDISPEYVMGKVYKRDNSKATFEELIKTSFDEKLLSVPIGELNLPVRASNALTDAGLKTIKDIVDFGLHALKKRRNVGRKTINGIKNAILTIRMQTQSVNDISFIDAIEKIFSSITPKYLRIIQARYGYDDGKRKTLEEISKSYGITRERVRQIIVKEIRRIKHPLRRKTLQTIIENIERLLFHYKGIISINDIAKDKYFNASTRKQLRFLINLIVDLYEERYRIISTYFITTLTDDEMEILQSKFREAALKCRFPIDEEAFIDTIVSFVGPVSKDFLSYHHVYKEHIEVSRGKVLSPGRLSIPQRVKLLLREIDRPMHFTEIAKLYRNHFGNLKIRTLDLERAIHTRIGDSKDFIIVDPGTFILRDKFKVLANIEMIVEMAKEILRNLKNVSDTRYLINELKRRNIDVGNLNAYSLKTILLEYPGFISYRKFEIGIEELADKYERKPLDDLIFEILSSTIKPMHVKTIWREISKQRGFPEYAVAQQLADDPRFIRISPATYTVAKNIAQYEEKQKIIIDFVKEWISLKGKAISAFFISEVLKEITDIKDLSLGLVENVLATSPEFIRLPNGFYDLIDKEENIKTV